MTAAIVGFIAIAIVGLHLRLRSGVSLALLAFTLAVAYASGYGHWRIAQIPASGEVGAVIQVDSMPERRLGFAPYYRFDARLVTLTCSDLEVHKKCVATGSFAKPLVQLNWYAESPPQLGDLIKANVLLRQAHGYQSPGAFDYGRWMFANGYSATGYIRNPESVEFIAKRGEYSYSTLRQRLLVAVAAHRSRAGRFSAAQQLTHIRRGYCPVLCGKLRRLSGVFGTHAARLDYVCGCPVGAVLATQYVAMAGLFDCHATGANSRSARPASRWLWFVVCCGGGVIVCLSGATSSQASPCIESCALAVGGFTRLNSIGDDVGLRRKSG